ncbi:MAG TPA: response regulator transcription factor [Usitatibacter sp.]|nr:response regulator transcription factor [Usitatibacter sp.]
MRKIRVLIVDDHDILRYGIRALLRDYADMDVVGDADSVVQAVERARELHPDVILMDARLPDGTGIDACREILSEGTRARVLFLSGYSDEQMVMTTLLAGASGHLSKNLDAAALADAIRKVADGGSVIDPGIRQQVSEMLEGAARAGASAKPEDLSPQEERVMALVVQGKTNRQIGEHMGLSEKTVKNYLHNAFQKLGVERRAHAASLFDMERLKRRLAGRAPKG